MRLLCVEDEASLREDIVEFLRHKSYVVDEASNGEEAIAQLNRHHYDLVLCDIKMPRMDGYELLQQVRKENQLSTTPFIFLTALNERDDRIRANENGCDGFLIKPIDFSVLESTLRAQVDRQRARDFTYSNMLDSTRSHAMAVLDDALSGPMAEVALTIQHLRDTLPLLTPTELDGYLANIQERAGKHALDLHTMHNALQMQAVNAKASFRPTNIDDLIKGALGARHYDALKTSHRLQSNTRKGNAIFEVDLHYMQRAISELLVAMPPEVKDKETIACKLLEDSISLTVADDEAMIDDEDFEPVDETTNLPSLSKVLRDRLVSIMFAMQVAHAHGGRIELKIWPESRLALRFILPRIKIDQAVA